MRVPTVAVSDVPDPIPDHVTVLDVREDDEWRAGRIPDSIHVPLQQLPGRIGELPDGTLLVVCKVGARSAQAAVYLGQRGHEAVNLDGGLLEWADAGRRLEADAGATPYVA